MIVDILPIPPLTSCINIFVTVNEPHWAYSLAILWTPLSLLLKSKKQFAFFFYQSELWFLTTGSVRDLALTPLLHIETALEESCSICLGFQLWLSYGCYLNTDGLDSRIIVTNFHSHWQWFWLRCSGFEILKCSEQCCVNSLYGPTCI